MHFCINVYIKKDMPRWLNMPWKEKDVAVFFIEAAFLQDKKIFKQEYVYSVYFDDYTNSCR